MPSGDFIKILVFNNLDNKVLCRTNSTPKNWGTADLGISDLWSYSKNTLVEKKQLPYHQPSPHDE